MKEQAGSLRLKHWSAEGGDPIEDLTVEDDLTPLPSWTPTAFTLETASTAPRSTRPSGTVV